MSIDELKGRLETALEPVVVEVEKGMIHRFAQAVGESEPSWQSVAPPAFIITIGFEQLYRLLSGGGTLIHGSTDLECYLPVRAGDTITAVPKVTGIRERPGKMGKTAFITIETNYTNQRQQAVAKCRQMVISY